MAQTSERWLQTSQWTHADTHNHMRIHTNEQAQALARGRLRQTNSRKRHKQNTRYKCSSQITTNERATGTELRCKKIMTLDPNTDNKSSPSVGNRRIASSGIDEGVDTRQKETQGWPNRFDQTRRQGLRIHSASDVLNETARGLENDWRWGPVAPVDERLPSAIWRHVGSTLFFVVDEPRNRFSFTTARRTQRRLTSYPVNRWVRAHTDNTWSNPSLSSRSGFRLKTCDDLCEELALVVLRRDS